MSDIDTVVMDSLKALDPNRPIREADMGARRVGPIFKVPFVAFRRPHAATFLRIAGPSMTSQFVSCARVSQAKFLPETTVPH